MTSRTPSCVMQMDPQPMPTLRASTPASIRFLACAAVTTTEKEKRQLGINIKDQALIISRLKL